MGPYETNQYTECVSEDESEDNVDETMVYLRVLYFYLYNLKITKILIKRSLVNAILIKLYEIYIKNLTYSTI